MNFKTLYYSFLVIAILVLNTATVFATDVSYRNPLVGGSEGDVNSFSDLLGNMLATIQGIVGVLVVLMLIVAGILYIFSGVSAKQVELAKNTATWAIIGFTIAIAAPSLLRELFNLAGNSPDPTIITGAKSFQEIFLSVLNFLLTIIGLLATISFVIGGYLYLSAGGDRNRAENAKKIVLYSIIAVLVSGSGVIIIKQIIRLLTIT